mmetsp:Transcript_51544/g.122613  ORF Transcript_51544/g.122613 Transcript_51544/m.122613 type:complete len:201 (+) Transcript_51544:562-1164(+)
MKSSCFRVDVEKETPGAMNNKSRTSVAHASLPKGSCISPMPMAGRSDDLLVSTPTPSTPLARANCSKRSNNRLVQPLSASAGLLPTAGGGCVNAALSFSGDRHMERPPMEGLPLAPPAAHASAKRWSVLRLAPWASRSNSKTESSKSLCLRLVSSPRAFMSATHFFAMRKREAANSGCISSMANCKSGKMASLTCAAMRA